MEERKKHVKTVHINTGSCTDVSTVSRVLCPVRIELVCSFGSLFSGKFERRRAVLFFLKEAKEPKFDLVVISYGLCSLVLLVSC